MGEVYNKDGRDWDLFLSAVALAYNTTPHTATGYFPFFLMHGRKAMLPVQRFLDEPRPDLESISWLSRLWEARVSVYERHAVHAVEKREWVETPDTLLPVGTIVAVKLNPQDRSDYSSKLGPLYMGPWVVVERFTNGKTYRIRDMGTEQERQVARDQIKVLDVPSMWKKDAEPWAQNLPKLGHVELGEAVSVPQNVCAEESPGGAGAVSPGMSQKCTSPEEAEPQKGTPNIPGDQVTREQPEGRYSLRQVPERLALQAEKRHREALKEDRRGRLEV